MNTHNPQTMRCFLRTRLSHHALILAACLAGAPAAPLRADPVYKNSTTTVTQTDADWVDGSSAPATPTASDVGHFGQGVPTGLTLAADVGLSGLSFDAVTASSTITINDGGPGHTLTLGADGITVDSAGHSVVFNHALALAANQAWTVGVGRSLVVNGPISGNFNLNLSSSAGPYTAGFRFTGSEANTYSGLTTVTLGALILDKDDGVNAIAANISATANGANIILASNEQIANTAIVTLGGGAKLILDGHTETIGGLAATGTNSLVQSTESASNRASKLIINVAENESYHFNGGILRDQSSGSNNALSIEKTGTGTQILEGRLQHTGTTTISAGTLVIRATGSVYHDNRRSINDWISDIINNATLNLQHTNTSTTPFAETLNVAISGTGNVIKSGPGRINLASTSSTYSGVTIFQEGTLGVASFADYGVAGSLGNRTADAVGSVGLLFRGGTLLYAGSTAQSTNRAIRIGTAGGTINASGTTPEATLKFTAASSPDLFEGVGPRTLHLRGSNTGRNEFNIQLTNQIVDETVNKTFLHKHDTGTWYITNTNNSYGGATILEGLGGILNVASLADYEQNSSLGNRLTDTGTPAGEDRVGILFRGATLQYTGSTAQSTNRAIRISTNGGAYIDASGSTEEATLHFTAPISPDLYENGGNRQITLTGSNTGNNTFRIRLTDQHGTTGKTTLNKTGTGTWVLVNTQTTLINSVTTETFNTYSGNTNIQQGILATQGFGIGDSSLVVLADEASATLRLDGNETIGALDGGGATGGTVNLQASALTLGGGNRDGSFAGLITSSGDAHANDLIKTGTGTQYLTGTNSTYSGFTMLAGGILNVAKIGNLGENSSIGNRTEDLNMSRVGLIFRGGTLQYTGDTVQSTDRAIRVSTIGGAFIDASGSNIDATLSFTRASSPDFFETGGDRQLTFTGTNEGNNTFNMAITQTGGLTTVNKTGTGTWRLTGTSTYTGATNISEGALLINGILANTSVSVTAGARLGGTGTIGGATTVSGMLSPGGDAKTAGHGMGTLTFSQTLAFADNSSYFVQLVGTDGGGGTGTADRINVASALTIGEGVNLLGTFSGTLDDLNENTRFWIGNNGGTWSVNGVFANSSEWNWSGLLYDAEDADFYNAFKVHLGGYDFALFYDANFTTNALFGGNDILLVAVIPEPSKAGLLLLGGALMLLRRQRLPRPM